MKIAECVCTCPDKPEIHPVVETINGKDATAWMCDVCGWFVCWATDGELANGLRGERYWYPHP